MTAGEVGMTAWWWKRDPGDCGVDAYGRLWTLVWTEAGDSDSIIYKAYTHVKRYIGKRRVPGVEPTHYPIAQHPLIHLSIYPPTHPMFEGWVRQKRVLKEGMRGEADLRGRSQGMGP